METHEQGRTRVLLVQAGCFMGGVIHSLLSGHAHMDVIEARPASERDLLSIVTQQQPDVVVLDDSLAPGYLRALLRFLQAGGSLRVVLLHTNNNRVQVFQSQQVEVRQSADFFELLG